MKKPLTNLLCALRHHLRLVAALQLALLSVTASAQKQHFIPNEWNNPWPADSLLYSKEDPDGRYTWSESRSIESDNVIVYWDKGYGSKRPDQLSKSDPLYVDIEDLLKKCEAFYQLEVDELGFVDPEKSNIAKYKVMVLMNHSTDWICYGGGYEFRVPALWLSPSTCHPVGSAVAHEVGHSFHYMCYGEDSSYGANSSIQTGFHGAVGKGACIWEQTAQWQSLQSYPAEIFSQSINVFRNSHNYAFSHEWHRYQSYWFLVYLNEKFGRHAVADVWNHRVTTVLDFNQVLMKQRGIKAADEDPETEDLSKLYLEYAMRCATWDYEAAAPYRDSYIGDFRYACCMTGDKTYQVAFSSAPQCSGFNVIPLQVPAAGTQVTTSFTALKAKSKLAAADPAEYLNGESRFVKSNYTAYLSAGSTVSRSFRLGYVALLDDGTRHYMYEDRLYCLGSQEVTEDVTCTVPEGTAKLWLVVVPSPRTYVQHAWDESISGDDMWPYSFALEGTDIGGRAIVYAAPVLDGREIADITLTYDVNLPISANNYASVPVTVASAAARALGTALQMNTDEISQRMVSYSASGPADGKIMFYAWNKDTGRTQGSGSTANGYGHWFNSKGTVVSYGSSAVVFSEFQPESLTFNVGQYPGKLKVGNEYSISQCLRYRSGNSYANAVVVFRIHATDGDTGYELADIDYNDPTPVSASAASPTPSDAIYTIDGRYVGDNPTGLARGIYVSGRQKMAVK